MVVITKYFHQCGWNNGVGLIILKNYRILPCEVLENPPLGKYRHSLFDENALMLKAHRPECSLLMPSGLFHAGHPRQRNTQMIYLDQAEFDDHQLLEKYLWLPSQMVKRQ